MFNFEGNYKSRREINLGGVRSTGNRDNLVKKTHDERAQREQERIRNKSATSIQVGITRLPAMHKADFSRQYIGLAKLGNRLKMI